MAKCNKVLLVFDDDGQKPHSIIRISSYRNENWQDALLELKSLLHQDIKDGLDTDAIIDDLIDSGFGAKMLDDIQQIEKINSEETVEVRLELSSTKNYKHEYERAVAILNSILTVSGNECEYDQDIYDFLKENDELPENYTPYWED